MLHCAWAMACSELIQLREGKKSWLKLSKRLVACYIPPRIEGRGKVMHQFMEWERERQPEPGKRHGYMIRWKLKSG